MAIYVDNTYNYTLEFESTNNIANLCSHAAGAAISHIRCHLFTGAKLGTAHPLQHHIRSSSNTKLFLLANAILHHILRDMPLAGIYGFPDMIHKSDQLTPFTPLDPPLCRINY